MGNTTNYPKSASTITDPPQETAMENEEDDEYLILKPSEWFPKLVSLQAYLIYNCLAILCAPIVSLLSVASESYHQAEEAKDNVESAVHRAPSTLTHGIYVLLKKVGFGFLGAAYVCMVLVMVLILSALLGIGLVNLWVEEPVFVRESLHFDYTEPHPTAVFALGGGGGNHYQQHKKTYYYSRKRTGGVPVGHTFYASLELLMPESDFNRAIGVFQISAELLSTNGEVIAKSSQPCMLRFRSFPVRLTRTFLMGLPLLLGISGETQKLTMQILRHKEGSYPRTQAIRVTLYPRAGTSYLPQLYEAEIVMNSQLPWRKQLVHGWKWTFYVWTSLHVYVMLLIFLFFFCKPLLSPMSVITRATEAANNVSGVAMSYTERVAKSYTEREVASERRWRNRHRESQAVSRDGASEDVQELLRRWQRSRSKRKAVHMQPAGESNLPETVGSSAPSTTSITREDTAEEVGDSESVCL